MTAASDKPEEQPAIKTLKFPSEAEMDALYAGYTASVGAVAHAWNHLQEQLAQLFSWVGGRDHQVGLAIWYSMESDRSQQKMLRAAILASKPDYWKGLHPSALEDLMWLVNRATELIEERNNALHAPCSLVISSADSEIRAAIVSGNPRARKLRGKAILEEFAYCTAASAALSRFAEDIHLALISDEFSWPDRPLLPNRPHQRSRQVQPRQPHEE
jgi:hypothetical protein